MQLDANGGATITAAQINNGSTDNCTITGYILNKTSFNCSDVGNNTVILTVTDGGGNSNTAAATVTVANATPIITSLTAPVDPVVLGTSINLTVGYADNNVKNATINWGDGNDVQNVPNPSNSFVTPYTYAATGVYRITVTLTDACGQTTSSIYEYVVVYDPSAGFVTGGGWINSPLGAYTADPTLTGKANFGFGSKYNKGATAPSGNTEFQFHAGYLNFKSSSYEWLVVSGSKAQFKGKGTINGSGDYGFLLSSVDGNLTSPISSDKFRIKIWDRINNAVVYDNQIGSADDSESTTAIAGGSIVIHVPKSAKSASGGEGTNHVQESVQLPKLTLRAMPNPSYSYFTIITQSNSTQPVSLIVTDILGRVVESNTNIGTNTSLRIGDKYRPGVYLVQVVQGKERQVIKLIKNSD